MTVQEFLKGLTLGQLFTEEQVREHNIPHHFLGSNLMRCFGIYDRKRLGTAIGQAVRNHPLYGNPEKFTLKKKIEKVSVAKGKPARVRVMNYPTLIINTIVLDVTRKAYLAKLEKMINNPSKRVRKRIPRKPTN